jgi:ADP-ribose pyrophosphatase YjhB (NUDIX family)
VGVFSHPRFNLHYPNGDNVQQWSVAVVARPVGGELYADGDETLAVQWMDVDEALPKFPPAYQTMVRAALDSPHAAVLEPIYAEDTLTEHWTILRRHVGHEPIILSGAMAVIPNERGEILVTRRADSGLWTVPGGYADLGETTTHTAVREVREETGLDIEPTGVIGVYSEAPMMTAHLPNGDIVHNVGIAFEGRITGGTLHPDGTETSAVAFKTIDDILAQSFPPNDDTPQLLRDFQQPDAWPFIR